MATNPKTPAEWAEYSHSKDAPSLEDCFSMAIDQGLLRSSESEFVLRYISPETVVKYNEESAREERSRCPFCRSKRYPLVTWEGLDGTGVLGGVTANGWVGLGCKDCKSEWTERIEVRNLGIEQEDADLRRHNMLPEDIEAMEKAGWIWNNKRSKWSKNENRSNTICN